MNNKKKIRIIREEKKESLAKNASQPNSNQIMLFYFIFKNV